MRRRSQFIRSAAVRPIRRTHQTRFRCRDAAGTADEAIRSTPRPRVSQIAGRPAQRAVCAVGYANRTAGLSCQDVCSTTAFERQGRGDNPFRNRWIRACRRRARRYRRPFPSRREPGYDNCRRTQSGIALSGRLKAVNSARNSSTDGEGIHSEISEFENAAR